MTTRVLWGIGGAIWGVFVAGAIAVLIVQAMNGGNTVGEGFSLFFFGPLALLIGVIAGPLLALRAHDYRQWHDADGRLLGVKRRLRVVGVAVGVPALALALFHTPLNYDNPPSDARMLADFHRNQATLNEIVQMAQADKRLSRVGSDWTNPPDPQTVGVSPARIARYRQLLKTAGIPEGLSVGDASYGIQFENWGTGSAISSDTGKGFAYLATPPAHTFSSLDECGPDPNGDIVLAYRHIEGNWYLYYDYLPG